MSELKLLLIAVICLMGEILYFRVADRFNIVDKPNHRTLHERQTIRGGGIIFPFAVMLYFIFFGVESWPFAIGLLLIAIVSFIDDLGHVNTFFRFVCHLLAISLITWQIGFFEWGWWAFILVVIISSGIINAYNFMDGINGITGGYSFVTVISLIFINNYIQPLEKNSLLWVVLISLVIFNYFNFRKNARCFAGDVGSISISFIIVYFILELIFSTGNLVYILLLAVYGVDSVLTILQRLWKRENIFEAHRSHLFQVIVFHKKMPHLQMSAIYMVLQLTVNLAVIRLIAFPISSQIFLSALILLILSIIYLLLKKKFLNVI